MHTKYTPALVLLTLFAIITSTLLVFSKIYYWRVIDFFTLPFFETPDLEMTRYLEVMRSHSLDLLIDVFGYDINAPFIAMFVVVFILCVIYAIAHRKNRAAYVPLICCFVSGMVFATIGPGVTVDRIARAIFEENDYTDPDVNYLDLLRSGKYSELDNYLKNNEKRFSANDIGEYQYIDEYEAFKNATEDDLVYFEKWLNQSADKKFPLIARGNLYEQLGWDARGGKFSRETTTGQFIKMKEYFARAVTDHSAVLEITNRSLISYASLINMASAYDFETDMETLFNQGLNEFPASYYLARKYMHKLQPKWGGSYRKIRSVAMRMREQAVDNPMLISLGNYELKYRARQLRKDIDETDKMRLKRSALFYGVTTIPVLNLATYYDGKNDTKNAITTLSQGLKFHPDDAELLTERAHYYALNDDFSSAIRDIAGLSPDVIYNAWISDRVADTYGKLQQPEKSVPFYKRAIKLDPKQSYPYNRLYWLSYKKVIGHEEVLPYMKKWTEIEPESSDAWISYASTLKKSSPAASIPAYKKFIKYANRNSSIDMNAVRHSKKFIKDFESR